MPLFQEDPAHLSKSRLKSDLVSHNVALPPAKSKKEVYVGLHLKHIDQKHAADFSSDEEDQAQDMEDKDSEDAEVLDPSALTDDDLKAALLQHGVKAGPIVASTRALYEKKLRTLLQSNGHELLNGTEKDELYSDSEEEEENGEEEGRESESEGEIEETVEQSEDAQQERGKVKPYFQKGGFVYPQCFLPSSRLQAHASSNRQPAQKWNSGNAVKASERSQSQCSQIPAGISRASSVDQLSGLGSGVLSGSQSVKPNSCSSFSSQAFSITQMVEEQMESQASLSASTDTEKGLNGSNVQDRWSRSSRDISNQDKNNMRNNTLYYTPKSSPCIRGMKPHTLSQEPVKDIYKEMFPDAVTTPTGIYASRRRPIKGAAGRPIQYAYPDSPLSPTTLERREVERRLVPIHIQLVVFFIVACLLYLFYVFAEDGSFTPVMDLLDSLNQESDSGEGLML
ncbi:LEM domain-containing protein 1 isoform X3 [Notolabrus celidotus]|uniref:LEM domain-containing protein 1 isoform X3 n=1 Tax=Notolabrus celidotus TaxID=1203425 RepID=UPI00148FFD97|nr:LEM domain-containing protein 1 isoform X3 [Notolabrus celidotus]